MNTACRVLAVLLVPALFVPAARAGPAVTFEHRGYIDAGLALTDRTRSWVDGGVGKDRYGAGGNRTRRLRPVLSEVALIGDVALGIAWRGHLHLKFDDQQRHPVDVAEAYLGYRSPPRGRFRWRFRAGTFLPPVSLENHGIGWTSPYTLASSALNAWVGEELRTNGGELKLIAGRDLFEISLFGSVYFANDAAGKLLASRGFAVHDRELGLFDRTPLPTLHALLRNPRGPFRAQVNH